MILKKSAWRATSGKIISKSRRFQLPSNLKFNLLLFFREKDLKLCQSSEERIKMTTERVENMYQKVEDINQKENAQTSSIQGVEFRLRKVEDVSEQILNHIAVVHRFMHIHMRDAGFSDLPEVKVAVDRLRKSSERSDDSKTASAAADPAFPDRLLSLPHRRRPTRFVQELQDGRFIFSEMITLQKISGL